jgi:hypothetical protein
MTRELFERDAEPEAIPDFAIICLECGAMGPAYATVMGDRRSARQFAQDGWNKRVEVKT